MDLKKVHKELQKIMINEFENIFHLRDKYKAAPAGEHMAHILSWAIQQNMTVFDVLQMPFYHPVVEEGMRTALRELAKQIKKPKNMEIAMCESDAAPTFVPPGIYRLDKPWSNEYWRLVNFNGAILRDIVSPAIPNKTLQELVLLFSDEKENKSNFIISGFEINKLPRLKMTDYSKGYFMLMGIGTPPVYQEYHDCLTGPPDKTPFFSVYIDSHDRWINHHEVAIDGSILFLDKTDFIKLHVYLVSYERHSLISHYVINLI